MTKPSHTPVIGDRVRLSPQRPAHLFPKADPHRTGTIVKLPVRGTQLYVTWDGLKNAMLVSEDYLVWVTE